MKRLLLPILIIIYFGISANSQPIKHTFSFSNSEFLLDGKPFQIISGEIHPARRPDRRSLIGFRIKRDTGKPLDAQSDITVEIQVICF